MDLGISKRIALISGADSGMGKDTARFLLEAGARVAITDKAGGTLEESLAELRPLGEIIAVTGDVTRPDEFRALLAADIRTMLLLQVSVIVEQRGVRESAKTGIGGRGDFNMFNDQVLQQTLRTMVDSALINLQAVVCVFRQSGLSR